MSINLGPSVITYIRCPVCKCQTEEFTSSNSARHYAMSHGWRKLYNVFICPECTEKHPELFEKKYVYKETLMVYNIIINEAVELQSLRAAGGSHQTDED